MTTVQLFFFFRCRRSTTTNRESYHFDRGRSVMKSMVIIPQMSVGTWFGCRGTFVLGLILVDWQTAQLST
jgi:hypothetical protein